MTLLLIVGFAWAALGLGVAILLCRGIRLADEQARAASWTDAVDDFVREESRRAGLGRVGSGPETPAV